MEVQGRGIFFRDQCIENLVSLVLQDGFQSGIELAANTFAPGILGKIDGGFGAPGIGGPGKGGAGIGIAQNGAVFLPDQPGKLGLIT